MSRIGAVGTWYLPGLGACGFENNSSQPIVAVSWKLYDFTVSYIHGNPNTNPVCGRKIHAIYKGGSVDVTVVDRCTGCNETDLDFSPGAFRHLADLGVGRLYNMTWNWTS
ncbi:RlpA-like double-psi beta-barrel-protein domain-containing protein-containing protein [Russula aff. rugulosa BPL654]|nr:RlpA-like double-psi beta-barrel-protein domain-containing protein-containing protein [Russula aff. rugulosa BPL654]